MKSKTVRQTKKTSAAGPKIETARAKYTPGEDEIRVKAWEIYFERIARGEAGTPEDDWHEAEGLLMGY